ncbi:hypothetical protein HF563_01590 [Acidithiobacillus ferridurans]|nr:hypothetical protein [Acidithiobacillus ferridurans]
MLRAAAFGTNDAVMHQLHGFALGAVEQGAKVRKIKAEIALFQQLRFDDGNRW